MPQLILFVFLAFAFWLLKRDVADRSGVSKAIWIPTLWFGVIASRPMSAWLGTGGSGDTLDGSPVDRNFYLLMILSALFTLSHRRVNWSWLMARNWAIVIFYGFLLISVAWANSPLVSFKRWFKESGNIIVALVILTEVNPIQAFRAVFVRCAYVFIPLSLIFIRYFPNLGRRYNIHSGIMEATGVTFQKNTLGTLILACGLILLWDWLRRGQPGEPRKTLVDRFVFLTITGIGAWLLYLCDSKTSILSLIIGMVIVMSIKVPVLRRRMRALGTYVLIGGVGFYILDNLFGVSEAVIRSMGRDMTFTGRTDVWRALLGVHTDSLLGTGFMSFWDDETYQSQLPPWVAFSAHNGYLEIYLAGGMIGVSALAIMILGVGVRLNRGLATGSDYSAVRFAIFIMMLIANFAESNFACMTSLGFLFLLAAIGEGRPEMVETNAVFAGVDGRIPLGTEAESTATVPFR